MDWIQINEDKEPLFGLLHTYINICASYALSFFTSLLNGLLKATGILSVGEQMSEVEVIELIESL